MGALFANAVKLLIIAALMGIMVLINYMMNEQALLLFFENWSVLRDRLVGPFFRQMGFGQATLSQLWAFLIAVASALGVAFLVHQFTRLGDLSRQIRRAREADMGSLLPELRARRISGWLRFFVLLVLVVGVLFGDGTLFFLRLSTLVYQDEIKEILDLPSAWTLLEISWDKFTAQLLVALTVGYLCMNALMAFLLEWAWVDFQASLDHWWRSLSERGAQEAAPPQAAPTAQPVSHNSHGEESPFDLDVPVYVNGSPTGERVTRRQALADPDTYAICPCGEVFRRDHYKIYGLPGCPVQAGTRPLGFRT